MAATIALRLRPKLRTAPNPTLIHFFSSSTSESRDDEQNNTSSPPSEPEPSFSAYFRDVKASLKQQSPRQHEPRKPFSPSSTTPSSPNSSRIASLDEIRKNLSEFRRRSAVPLPSDGPSSPPPPSQHISLQELYRRNVISKGEGPKTEINKGGTLSFDAIRESLRQLRSNAAKNQGDGGFKSNESMSLSKFKESFNLRPIDPSARESTVVIGDTHKLPSLVFGKEMKERNEAESAAMKTEFLKMYSYGELGEKLRQLRPEAKGQNWFTLEELNQRLIKLREIEEKESDSSIGGVRFKDLRDSLRMLRISDEEKSKKSTFHRINILSQLDGNTNFMLSPPKEHLVEKYFHPDNMSSAEKLKIELKKVRDEFKMSETDCGSARVQVTQLTTKIKHLSTVLHKKDKHSRKGLQEMVQKRKKLLKYLRKTDWDSYCFVLSKLGLRDNPDYKF